MPSWPTQIEYREALQNPGTAFRDPHLQQGEVENSRLGAPRARAGAFASVYKISRGSKATAIKLYNFPNVDRAIRYAAISDHLTNLGSERPRSMIRFEYKEEGIQVLGKGWFPILKMEWVNGKPLGLWVREAMDRKIPDTAAVRTMADSWSQLVAGIERVGITHGDLQHDNVMVAGTSLVLVDYDGMCVPALAQLEQLEFGKPAYQHPLRVGKKLGAHLDHFAAWVVLIALRAMAADPSLYVRYVLETDNENLLFTPTDIAAPASSNLWPELLKCKDQDVKKWSLRLRESLDKDFDKIPPFVLESFGKGRFAGNERKANNQGSPRNPIRVFVSHATKDRDFVEREIIAPLEGAGIKPWYSKTDVRTGSQWERSILQGLDACEWFLLVMSRNSSASEWVKDEVQWAIENRPDRIIPVLIEDCNLRDFHIRMARIQFVDFRRPIENAADALLSLFDAEH